MLGTDVVVVKYGVNSWIDYCIDKLATSQQQLQWLRLWQWQQQPLPSTLWSYLGLVLQLRAFSLISDSKVLSTVSIHLNLVVVVLLPPLWPQFCTLLLGIFIFSNDASVYIYSSCNSSALNYKP